MTQNDVQKHPVSEVMMTVIGNLDTGILENSYNPNQVEIALRLLPFINFDIETVMQVQDRLEVIGRSVSEPYIRGKIIERSNQMSHAHHNGGDLFFPHLVLLAGLGHDPDHLLPDPIPPTPDQKLALIDIMEVSDFGPDNASHLTDELTKFVRTEKDASFRRKVGYVIGAQLTKQEQANQIARLGTSRTGYEEVYHGMAEALSKRPEVQADPQQLVIPAQGSTEPRRTVASA